MRLQGATGPLTGRQLQFQKAWWLGLLLLAAILSAGCASQPDSKRESQSPLRVITDFLTLEDPDTVSVMVKSTQPLTYTATKQAEPRGVYFQFPATALDEFDTAYFPPSNPVIRSIRTEQAADNGPEARVFLELFQDLPYEIVADREGLKVVFRKPSVAVAAAGPPAASPTEPETEEAQAPPPVPAATLIREVRVETQADAVIIRVTADGALKEANVFTLENPARIVFDFMGVQSAYKGEQRISVRSEWVSQIRHFGYPEKVRLVADTEARHVKSYSTEPTPDGLVIRVGKKTPGVQ